MKYALVTLALAAAARAQSASDIPECALPCINDAIEAESDCSTTDFACACENLEAIQGAATGCVLSECGADVALQEVIPAIEAICAAVGDGETPSPTSSAAEEEPTSEEPTSSEEEATETDDLQPTMPTIEPEPTIPVTVTRPTPVPTPSGEPIPLPTPTDEPTTPGPAPTNAANSLKGLGAVALGALGLLAL